ncbi:hypothetical protein [Nostoc sp. MG11]|uniref:hypothetical protein n=1 Tax=Nostoc sp. MG11 TaxID=2721166 RepID=UPI0018679B35|nr:hypothetical protein [Nostoc sp. MG11]
MTNNSNTKLTNAFDAPDFDIEAQNEVEHSNRVLDRNLPSNNALGGFQMEIFAADVNSVNIKIDRVFQITKAIAHHKASQLEMRSRKCSEDSFLYSNLL